jgi:phage-related protein
MAEVGVLRVSLGLDSANFTRSLSEVNRKLKAVESEFKAVGGSVKGFENTLEGLRAKSDMLTKKIDLQSAKVQELKRRYEESAATKGKEAAETEKLLIAYNKAVGDLKKLENELQQTSAKLDKLSQDVNQNATVWDKMRTKLNEVGQRLQDVGSRMQSAGQDIAASFGAASLAIGGALGFAVNKSMDFEAQLSSIKAVSGATGEQIEQLKNLAIEMGSKTKYSGLEAAQGIEELIKAGVSLEDIINGGLEGALSLATAGELDLAQAAEIASTALNAFKADALSVQDAANILAGAANASATDVGELQYGLSAVSAVASGVGLTFKDTATALALFAQNGLKGSDAGTSLKTMLMNLTPKTADQFQAFNDLGLITFKTEKALSFLAENGIKPASNATKDVVDAFQQYIMKTTGAKKWTQECDKVFRELGLSTGIISSEFYKADGSLKSMEEIAGILQTSLKGLNAEQRQLALYTMFGSDAIRAANILFKEGADGINKMYSEMSKVTAVEVANEKMNNLKGRIEELKGAFETAQITIGNALAPAVGLLVNGLQKMVDWFNNLSPSMQKFIAIGAAIAAAVTGIVAAFGVVLAVIGGAVNGFGALSGAFASVAQAISKAGGMMGVLRTVFAAITGPIGIAIAAITGLTIVFVKLYKENETFRNGVQQVWDQIKSAFSVALTYINSIVQTVMNAVSSFISSKLSEIKAFWQQNGEQIKQAAQNVWSVITKVIEVAMTAISAVMKVMWPIIKALIISTWEAIKGVIDGALKVILGIVKTFSALFTGNFRGVWEGIKQIFVGSVQFIWNWINLMFIGKLLGGVKALATSLVGNIGSMWATIRSVFGASVNTVKSIVDSGFNFIKNFVSNTLGTVKTTVSTIWSGVKTVFSTTVNTIKSVVTNGFITLKNAVSKAMDGVKTAIETGWNKAKSFLQNIDLKQIGKDIIQGLINGLGSMMGLVEKKISEIANSIPAWAKKILGIHSPSRVMAEVGQWTTVGFAKGIESKKKDAETAAKKTAAAAKKAFEQGFRNIQYRFDAKIINAQQAIDELEKLKKQYATVPNAIARIEKEIYKIRQQSAKQVFEEQFKAAQYNFKIGKIDESQYISKLRTILKEYAKTSDQIRKVNLEIKKVQEEQAKKAAEIAKKTFEQGKQAIEYQKQIRNVSLEQELQWWNNLAKKFKKGTKERIEAEKEFWRVKEEITKRNFENEKRWFEEKKYYGQLSLTQELESLNTVAKRYKEGSEERLYWEREIYRVKKEINDKLLEANNEYAEKVKEINERLQQDELKAKEEYEQKVKEINERLAEDERKLTEEYEKAVEDRTKSLYSFAGIFDEFKRKSDVSGQGLLQNLADQVNAFKDWQANIVSLAARGIDEGLLQELRDMGPKAVDEIAALNSLSDTELQQYVQLWREKNALAKTQAVNELEGMRQQTQAKIQQLRATASVELEQVKIEYTNKIAELRAQANAELEQHKNEWIAKVKEITEGTKTELNLMTASMADIGKNSMQGLIDGLNSMMGPLKQKAQEIASIVEKTVKSTLKIKSPSRVMMELGGWIPIGLAEGISRNISAVVSATNRMAQSAIPSLAAGSFGREPTPATATINVPKMAGAKIENHFHFHSTAPTPSEVARKNLQVSRQLAMEWGL